MLQRTTARLLTPAASPKTPSTCAVCTCRCGSVFRNNASSTLPLEQRRSKTYKAPATYAKERRLKPRLLTPTGVDHKRKLEEAEATFHYTVLSTLYSKGTVTIAPEIAVHFLNELHELAQRATGRTILTKEAFNALVKESAMSDGDLSVIAHVLMRGPKEGDRSLGKKLLFTLSGIGHAEATIRILNHAFLANKARPNMLRSSEILYARGHLRDIARQGVNFRGMVLEGKIAHELGDEDYAIDCWNRAMDAAVTASNALRDMKDPPKDLLLTESRRDLSELSTPWIELTLVHYNRYERLRRSLAQGWRGDVATKAQAEYAKAEKAMRIGCEQDDPTSHFHAAMYFNSRKRLDDNGNEVSRATSTWLYHITKAAASGHVRAAHGLAEFYAESGWKYIEDEPDDHLKPTPFDSYPASTIAKVAGTFDTFLGLIGLKQSQPPNPRDALFHTAVFPSTPHERVKLAWKWADLSASAAYAPTYLLWAKLTMTEKLWGEAYAPQAALQMQDSRYTHTSKADFDAGKPLETTSEPAEPDEPNPYYIADKAKDFSTTKYCLAQVFHAVEADRLRKQLLARDLATRKRNAVDEDDVDLPQNVHWNIRKWLMASEVREMYEDDIHLLEAEAKRICEKKQWDIYDKQGGLVYKHGLSQTHEANVARAAGAVG